MAEQGATAQATAQKPLQAAQEYAARGWRIFPLHTCTPHGACTCGRPDCPSPAKHPRTKNGLKDATEDAGTLTGWWRRWPDANVGIVTGQRSGLVVLDVDQRHGGMACLHSLCTRYGDLPETLMAFTGGGGLHVLFAHPGGDVLLRNKAGLHGYEGLDVRGDGGYIVAAPSVHISGNRYEWIDAATPIAPLPDWLLHLLLERDTPPPSQDYHTRQPEQTGPNAESARFWLDHYLREASEGNRNNTGLKLARQLRDSAFLPETEAETYMLEYAERVPGGGIDYTTREALATLRSVYSRPAGEPARGRERPAYDPSFRYDTYDSYERPAGDEVPPDYGDAACEGERPEPARQGPQSQQQAKAAKPSRFRVLTAEDVEAMPPPEWLVHGMLQVNTLSMVYGTYGSAKSFLVLDWALSVATGRSWLGRPVRQGFVVYAAGEGVKGLGKRIRAWRAYHEVSEAPAFRVIDAVPQLLRPDDVSDFVRVLKSLPETPALMVLDTLSRCLVGKNENAQEDMSSAIQAADDISRLIGCHVLLVHHKGKGDGPRGSTVIPGGVETILEVTRDGKCVTVTSPKQKDEDEGKAGIHLRMHVVALDEHAALTSCVLLRNEGHLPSTTMPDQRKRSLMLSVLAKHPAGMNYTDWQQACEAEGLAKGNFDYHRRNLTNEGAVLVNGGIYTLPGVSAGAT